MSNYIQKVFLNAYDYDEIIALVENNDNYFPIFIHNMMQNGFLKRSKEFNSNTTLNMNYGFKTINE